MRGWPLFILDNKRHYRDFGTRVVHYELGENDVLSALASYLASHVVKRP